MSLSFPRNGWYAALWSSELQAQPVARTILDEPVVFFRTASGQAAALADRCCHRAAPLSRGEVIGEILRCGYHGLSFDVGGHCVAVPSQVAVPPGATVRSFLVREKWNVLWVWMGDPALADESKIAALTWLDDPAWVWTPGYIHLECNTQLLVDNLLDFTHVAYLHRNTIAGDPQEATVPVRTERSKAGIRVGRWMRNINPPPLFAAAGGFNDKVDRWQWAMWTPPSTVYIDVGCARAGTGAPEGDRRHGISIWSNHLVTPESATSSHYLFAFARNFQIEDKEMTRLLFEGSRDTFLEDKVMLEAQQRNLRGGDLDGLIDINADAAQLQTRRMLEELARAETTAR